MSLPECVRHGKTAEVLRLLRDGMSCNSWGHTGKAPLHIAATEGHLHLANILLQAKADIDRQTGDRSKKTALHVATESNDKNMVLALLEAGAKVNMADEDGWTALHKVTHNGNLAVATMLIDHGADINARDHDGVIPLHTATFKGHLQLVKLLLKSSGDHNAYDTKLGAGCLHRAVRGNCIELVELLLRHAAALDVNKDPLGLTDPNFSDYAGWTALHHAAANGRVAIAQLLLVGGAEFEATTCSKQDKQCMDKGGKIPLHLATVGGHDEVGDVLRAWEYSLIDEDGDGDLTMEEMVAFVRKTEQLDPQEEKIDYLKPKPKRKTLPGPITTPESIDEYVSLLPDDITFLDGKISI